MSDEKQPIIIKKINKVAGGHHGGAWKVAYADFVTAMMAFFLLLWLLNVTTDEQKQGIAEYFTPNVVSSSMSGGGGVLGGRIINDTTANRSSASPTMIPTELPPAGVNPDGSIDNTPKDGGSVSPANEIEQDRKSGDKPEDSRARKREESLFKDTEQEIRQVVESDPELADLSQNLLMDMTRDGLRIQLVDSQKYSMFEPGTDKLTKRARTMLQKISDIVKKMPNKIAIAGHTDSYTYSTGKGYTNWELSSDRANASRRAMLDTGLPEARINRILGKADKEHLFPDPYDPRNRRVSITVLREAVIEGFQHRGVPKDQLPEGAQRDDHSSSYIPENGRVPLSAAKSFPLER